MIDYQQNTLSAFTGSALDKDPDLRYVFWVMQGLFWSALALATFLTLTLWYGTGELSHIAHTVVQAAIGLMISVPLHLVYSYFWQSNIVVRCLVGFVSVIVFAALWTSARMQTFIWMTSEGSELWLDFGGWYFSGIFVFLGWTATYHGIFYYFQAIKERNQRLIAAEKSREDKIKRIRAEQLADQARLQMLRYQLNPHFLFNTLNAITSLIKLQESTRASDMVQKLSRFLRYSLDSQEMTSVALKKELEALQLYLSIEEIRFSDRLTVNFDIEDGSNLAQVPGLILQPLVENALKYAIASSEVGGVINVISRIEDNYLALTVEDTGPGIAVLNGATADVGMHFNGVGIRNTQDRLKTLYGKDFVFNLENRCSGGLRVNIRLPFTHLA